MEGPWKGVMEQAAADGESTESVVLQCTSSGDVEDGEEVVCSQPAASEGHLPVLPTSAWGTKAKGAGKLRVAWRGWEWEQDVRFSSSGVQAWRTEDSAYWNSRGRVRTRWWKEKKGYVEDVGEACVVEKAHLKRKLEESKECDRLTESELDEGIDSDAESATSSSSSSSSDSDASESEEISWKANKRRRAGEEVHDAVRLKFGSRRGHPSSRAQSAQSSQKEITNCGNKVKEMQLLLELHVKASERREAGMKQRMESMMDLMSRHMGHAEKRVSTLEVGVQPQEQVLERINVKLEKVMEGFTTLNENLSLLSACLSRDFDSQ